MNGKKREGTEGEWHRLEVKREFELQFFNFYFFLNVMLAPVGPK